MSEEEKQTLDDIRYRNEHLHCDKTDFDFILNLIDKLQKELDKKDKVINLMAEVIEECRQNDVIEFNENIDLSEIAGENRIKEYFYKKVEEENE